MMFPADCKALQQLLHQLVKVVRPIVPEERRRLWQVVALNEIDYELLEAPEPKMHWEFLRAAVSRAIRYRCEETLSDLRTAAVAVLMVVVAVTPPMIVDPLVGHTSRTHRGAFCLIHGLPIIPGVLLFFACIAVFSEKEKMSTWIQEVFDRHQRNDFRQLVVSALLVARCLLSLLEALVRSGVLVFVCLTGAFVFTYRSLWEAWGQLTVLNSPAALRDPRFLTFVADFLAFTWWLFFASVTVLMSVHFFHPVWHTRSCPACNATENSGCGEVTLEGGKEADTY